jgi:hypothetical protein
MLLIALVLAFRLSVLFFDGQPGEKTAYDIGAAASSILVFILTFLAWREAPRWLRALQLTACVLALVPLLWATRAITGVF